MDQTGLLISGQWHSRDGRSVHDVHSPYSGDVIGQVVQADSGDIDHLLDTASQAKTLWRNTPAHERSRILLEAARLADERAEELARVISAETGKSIREARGEAGRAGEILRLSAFEGAHRYGDSLPLDANMGTGLDKIGFTVAQPVGVVVAITPFNYPALLVLHKLGPALAAGNAVVVKPAAQAPLTANHLAQCLIDAGLPDGVLSVVNGPGQSLGAQLVSDPRVNKVSFTGSTRVGEQITKIAGVKRLSLELGASSPVVVTASADVQQAAQAVSLGGYINAGQVCISVQRVIVEQSVEDEFIDALTPLVNDITVGDPSRDDTAVGTLISAEEAARVRHAIDTVVGDGATLVTGGEVSGAIVQPAIVRGVPAEHQFSQDELFGPAVSITSASDLDEALDMANSTRYGLGAGVFSHNLDTSIRAIREIDSGIVHINWTPLWRADLMPYGGLKDSGIGKEGVRTAVSEMTDWKTVIMHSDTR